MHGCDDVGGDLMSSEEYEKSVLEFFRIEWPEPSYQVRHDVRLRGKKTKALRQIDVAIYAVGEEVPLLLIEAKRHGDPIDAGVAGSSIAMVQDLGGIPTIMVSTLGFSKAAANHLDAESIGHMTITLKDARALRWISKIEKLFAVDREFKIVSGELVEALRAGEAEPFFDCDIPYEEWLAVINTGISLFPKEAQEILMKIAYSHFYDDHRYNALKILHDVWGCDRLFIEKCLAREKDGEVAELLEEMLEGI